MSTREDNLRRIMHTMNRVIGLVTGLTGAIMMITMANHMMQMYIVAQEIARTTYANAISGTGVVDISETIEVTGFLLEAISGTGATDMIEAVEVTAIPAEAISGTGATDISETVEEVGIGMEAESNTEATSMSETIEVTSTPEHPP